MARIVLVDDNLTTLKRLEALLIPLGHEVVSFTGAEPAMQLLKFHHVDLAVLDLAMPIHSGYDLMQTLRAESIPVPILVVSGKSKNEEIQKAIQLGAHDYILKPFDDDIFVAKVGMLLTSNFGKADVSHDFAEAHPADPGTVTFPLAQMAVSELGFSFRSPVPAPPGMRLNLNIPFLEELGLEKNSLKISSVSEDPKQELKYKIFVSFIGLNPAQLQKVRLWVRENQIRNKKAA